jgi:LysR family nitrogen assimilation transcriptional regulator
MDLKQLAYFVHVAELGSFSRAAAVLSIAQPALSRQVRLLEVELRQNLLRRTGRGVSPTEAGKRLMLRGRGILQQVDHARHDLEGARGAPVGHVVVGLPSPVGRRITPALVKAFRQRFPRATLCVVEGLTAHILDWIAVGRVDAGLVFDSVPASAVVETSPLVEEQLHLVGAAGANARRSPIAMAELAGIPMLLPSRPNALRMLVETRLAEVGVKLEVACEIDSVTSILELVAAGEGATVLILNALPGGAGARRFAARPIVRPRLDCILSLARPAQRPLTPLGRAALDLLRELVPSDLYPRHAPRG